MVYEMFSPDISGLNGEKQNIWTDLSILRMSSFSTDYFHVIKFTDTFLGFSTDFSKICFYNFVNHQFSLA